MAFHLEKEKTTSSPYILVDEKHGYMLLQGKCFHENVALLFAEVNDWLTEYLTTPFGVFTFDCETEYFNSSTTKLLHNMLMLMDRHSTDENRVVVNWKTTEDNDIMVECGEDFREDVSNIEFNLIIKESA